METTGRLGAKDGNFLVTYNCSHTTTTPDNLQYREILMKLSPHLKLLGCHLKAKKTNICFRHAVFGYIKRTLEDRQQFFE